jgi:hypothetical protein
MSAADLQALLSAVPRGAGHRFPPELREAATEHVCSARSADGPRSAVATKVGGVGLDFLLCASQIRPNMVTAGSGPT